MKSLVTTYPVVRGWFKGQLHLAYGDAWYRRMMRARRCRIPIKEINS